MKNKLKNNQEVMVRAIKLGFAELIDDGMGTPFYATIKEKFQFEYCSGYSRFIGVEDLNTLTGAPLHVLDMDENILVVG